MARRLRKISKKILHEESEETERSFEWRRRFNGVSLRLSELTTSRNFEFDEAHLDRDPESESESESKSESNRDVAPSSVLTIKGVVNKEELRDRLLFAENVADG